MQTTLKVAIFVILMVTWMVIDHGYIGKELYKMSLPDIKYFR